MTRPTASGVAGVALVVVITLIFVLPQPTLEATEGQGFIDSPRGRFTTLNDAINNSHEGDTLNVYGGIYHGPISVDKTLTIIGHDWPVLDGQNNGTVMTLKAPNIFLKGFVIKNSGKVLDQENS